VVVQLVQEVDHAEEEVVVVVVIVIDHPIVMINLDVQDFSFQSYLYNYILFLAKSPSQQQSSYYQQTGEYQNDDQQQQQQQSRPYRGGSGRSFSN
jgi:hypothetical protein